MRIWLLIACVLVLMTGAAFAQQLDEHIVLKLISDFDRAIAGEDVDGLAGFLSDKIGILANVRASGRSQKPVDEQVDLCRDAQAGLGHRHELQL